MMELVRLASQKPANASNEQMTTASRVKKRIRF